MKLNSYLLKASIVGAFGGLLFGFDTAVIAGTTHSLTEVFNLSPLVPGHYGLDCSVGDSHRRVDRWRHRAASGWTQCSSYYGGALHSFVARLRLRLELARAC